MKKILVLIALCIAQISFAQVSKNLGDFDEVKVFDRISLELVPSDENRIEIFGSRNNEVEIVNRNGELKIRMSLQKLLKGEEVKAILYFKKIESIDASEGSFVSASKTFKQTSIALSAKEGSEIQLQLDVRKVKVKAVTGGIIRLSGKAVNQEVTINTGGILAAQKLQTSQTTVNISAGGEAEIYASEFVDAQVRVGGTVTIFGKPQQSKQKTILGGTIIEGRD